MVAGGHMEVLNVCWRDNVLDLIPINEHRIHTAGDLPLVHAHAAGGVPLGIDIHQEHLLAG